MRSAAEVALEVSKHLSFVGEALFPLILSQQVRSYGRSFVFQKVALSPKVLASIADWLQRVGVHTKHTQQWQQNSVGRVGRAVY